jgi:hypothetical protein
MSKHHTIPTIGAPGAVTYQIMKRAGLKIQRDKILRNRSQRRLLPGIIRPCCELPPGTL